MDIGAWQLTAPLIPLVALLLLGRLLRTWGVLTANGVDDLGRLLYWVLLPTKLVVECARADLTRSFDGRVLIAVLGAWLIGFIGGWWATRGLAPPQRGATITAVCRANGAFIGLPVIALLGPSLGGDAAIHLPITYAVIFGLMVPVFNVGSVLGFRLVHHDRDWRGLLAAFAEIPRNPIIIGAVTGMALGVLAPGLLAASPLGATADLAGGAAIPLAVLVSGAQLSWSVLKSNRPLLWWSGIAKLILVPMVAWLGCLALGVDRIGTICAVVLMGSPVAMASVPMARLLGGDDRLMAAMVMTTTIVSPLTIYGWLWLVTR